ncbi:NUDIX domain-containing protein [Endozoicomonadaceae bacterium StTr2]
MTSNTEFSQQDINIENIDTPFSGHVRLNCYQLRHRLYEGGWSASINREVMVRQPAVGVLLFDPEKQQVVMVEQFRPGAMAADDPSPWLLEVVAGLVEPGESVEDVARREAIEESGCQVSKLIPITEYYLSPGASNEKITLFCGLTDAAGASKQAGLETEHEDIRVHTFSVEQAFELMQQGKINNATTLIAMQWLQLNLDKLKP